MGQPAAAAPRQRNTAYIRLLKKLRSVLAGTRARIVGLSVLDQNGQIVGTARKAPDDVAHHAHISLSLTDPVSGTVIGAAVFELDAAQL
ncbi:MULTISPECIES: hypothetical protein [Roseobacteraceae]|uniref:Uncharacterized protein n=1 Tax=Pseudosulfitobacter pseudonitzschiae TaxID=1402135 RepID=A0A221JZV0_9RHOB|nr:MULTISPECIES: hypothetical protein [Roseobacteraceae]ASM72288.1 hypothetical protein SULPSESMR1_01472 [Pseudosulfitobacter pseudonitzschiae]